MGKSKPPKAPPPPPPIPEPTDPAIAEAAGRAYLESQKRKGYAATKLTPSSTLLSGSASSPLGPRPTLGG